MATMPMYMPVATFDAVEDNVQFVSRGLSLAQKMNMARRLLFSLFTMTLAFRQVVREQNMLLNMMDKALRDDYLPPMNQMLVNAERLEEFALVNERILNAAENLDFAPWKESLRQMKRQAERFHCIGETLRMIADPAMKAHILDLVESAEAEAVGAAKTDWRDFVGSLHD